MPPFRIIVLGTGDFALPTFNHLVDSGCQVVALVTQPDRPQGRKRELIPSLIKQSAQAKGIAVEQPENVNAPEALALIAAYAPDLLVTAAYGQILSPELLGLSRLGGINLHGSILPKYRGAAPVARAIERGESETGVTVIRMTPRIDAGGMLAFARTPIDPAETAGELEDRLALVGAPLVLQTIQAIADGTAEVLPQSKSKVTKAPKLSKDDGWIDWTLPSQTVHNLVRAMQPWPLADLAPTHRPSPADHPPVGGRRWSRSAWPGPRSAGRPPRRRGGRGGGPALDRPDGWQETVPGRRIPPGPSSLRRLHGSESLARQAANPP